MRTIKEKNIIMTKDEADFIINGIADLYIDYNELGKEKAINIVMKLRGLSTYNFESRLEAKRFLNSSSKLSKILKRIKDL